MAAVTLTTLRARVRELADMGSTTFVTDTDTSLDSFINVGVQKLHDIVLEGLGGTTDSLSTLSSSSSVVVASGTGTTALPAGFYELIGVDVTVGGQVIDMKRFSRKERNSLRSQSVFTPRQTPQYMIDGANLRINGPDGTYSVTLYYVPVAQSLVAAGDTISYPNGWEFYAVLYAAMLCVVKEEGDPSALLALIQMEAERIESAAKADAASPPRMVDVEAIFTDSAAPWEV